MSDIIGILDEKLVEPEKVKLTKENISFDLNWFYTKRKKEFIQLFKAIQNLNTKNIMQPQNILSHYTQTLKLAERARLKYFPKLRI